jgi:hypothetical protein
MGFNDIFQQLSLLQLSVYAPISYILPSRLQKYEEMYDTEVEGGKGKLRQQDREKSLQALMTTNLLKRLESSVYAFRLTLQNLQNTIDATLDKIEEFERNGNVIGVDDWTSSLESIEADDDDFATFSDDNTIGGKIKINLADMDVLSWKHDLMADKQLIEALIHDMNKITPEDDLKLQHIKAHILNKVNNPINPGNRKVIVFTAFADTADYLYEHLAPSLLSLDIHSGKVTGKSTPKTTIKKGYDFQEILTLFSPKSKDKDKVLPKEPHDIDLLIGTDCISEGQNLQDGDYLINFDIHWNPVRIIQRFGRIDRIGSINQTIQLVNYWPDISLDEYINLKERVESRMTIVDVAATGDDNVLSSQSNDVAYRKEQLRRLQDEVIELEDVRTGISITDLGLNEFRMDLLNYIKTYGDLGNMPNGMHAVVPSKTELGLQPGVIFTLRSLNLDADINQQNRLHPYYLIYINLNGELVHNQTEVKRLLDLVRTCCKGQVKPITDVCQRFNSATSDGRKMQVYSDLLSRSIRSMIDVKEEKDLDSLFSAGKTTALTNTIAGLDDFELVSFIVVQD